MRVDVPWRGSPGVDVCSVRVPGMRLEDTSELSWHAYQSTQPTLCVSSPGVGTLPYPWENGSDAVASWGRSQIACCDAVLVSSVD